MNHVGGWPIGSMLSGETLLLDQTVDESNIIEGYKD